MEIYEHPIAVCSWSLQPKDMTDLVAKVKSLGLEHIQLALAELLQMDDKRKHQELGHLRASGIELTGGMMAFDGEDYSSILRIRETGGYVPDADWPIRKRLSIEGAKLARELGVRTVTTHVGFIPPPGEPRYKVMHGRISELAEAFSKLDVDLLMETGQEPAHELLHFLQDLKAHNVFINFDPANMILYGAGDPIEAIGVLANHIRHVHVKDGTASGKPGVEWGAEVPFGKGQVGAARFLEALGEISYDGALAIEREAGNDRMGDVAIAIKTLTSSM
jgi:sugar phosphate isomerase/epimerase